MTAGESRDPYQAREELKRLLNDLLERRGWSQADLVRQLELQGTSLVKATISKALDPDHPAPGTKSLKHIAKALQATAKEEKRLESLRTLATRSPDLLELYLLAARRAVREHPYAGVLTGETPPLASVYLRQCAHVRESGPQPSSLRAESSVSGEELLSRDGNCLVLGGPGGGKTSLLRVGMTAALEHRMHGDVDTLVPILLPAAELATARPLPEAIVESVTSELVGFGLMERIPPDFFRAPPSHGSRWRLLVDGLDEVTDPTGRRRVLQTLEAIARDAEASPYRFVLATRPLPGDIFDTLHKTVPQYELRPFEPEELTAFAEQWFSCLELPDPATLARSFVATVSDSGLLEPACTPLMATMLCQLRAKAPEGPLPLNRGAVYQHFVDLLHERQHSGGRGGITTQTEAALGRYGPDALERAHRAIDCLVGIIAHVAAEQHRGNAADVLTIVDAHPGADRPVRVPPAAWNDFLGEALRRSGLLTVHAGKFVFLHQTLMEHLAARHIADDDEASDLVVRELFVDAWSQRSMPWARRKWHHPPEETSFLGFLLDAWRARCRDVDGQLERLAKRGGLAGWTFIVGQKALGTALPSPVVDTAVRKLHTLALGSKPFDEQRVSAAVSLTELGDEDGPNILAELAGGFTLRGDLRVEAARRLAILGDSRGRDLLANMATGSVDTSPKGTRRRAKVAHIMATYVFDHPDRMQMAVTYYGADVCGMVRVEAAATLSLLGDDRAMSLLTDLAMSSDPDLLAEHRVVAADFLARHDVSSCCDALVDIATTSGHWDHARVDAGKGLMKLRDPRAPYILDSLADDPELTPPERARAAKHRKRYSW